MLRCFTTEKRWSLPPVAISMFTAGAYQTGQDGQCPGAPEGSGDPTKMIPLDWGPSLFLVHVPPRVLLRLLFTVACVDQAACTEANL